MMHGSLMITVTELVSFSNSHNRKVRELVPDDAENCLAALRKPCGLIGILVLPMPPKEHAHAVERDIRTINNMVTCTLLSMSQKFPPTLLFYAKQAAAICHALSPCPSKDNTTSIWERFTDRKFEYHKEFPHLPFGVTVLSEVGIAHRSTDSSKTGYPVNNTAKSELGVNLSYHAMGTMKGCTRIYLNSGAIVPRRNFEPVNAFMTGWLPNDVIKQSQNQYEIIDNIDLPIPSLASESSSEPIIHTSDDYINEFPVPVDITKSPLSLTHYPQTILQPTAISVPSDFYSSDIVPSSTDSSWTSVLSKKTKKIVESVPPPPMIKAKNTLVTPVSIVLPPRHSYQTRYNPNAVVSNISINPNVIDSTNILNLRKEIKSEHSLTQALKLDRLQAKLPAACGKELSKIAKFQAGTIVKRNDLPKNAILFHFLMSIKEKMLKEGETDPQINARLCVDGNRQPETSYGKTYAGTSNNHYLLCWIAAAQAYANVYHLALILAALDIEAAFLQAGGKKHNPDFSDFPPCYAKIPSNIPSSVPGTPHELADELILLDCGWYGKPDAGRLFWLDIIRLLMSLPQCQQ